MLADRPPFIGPRALINRREYVRLLEQALHHLGYSSIALALEQESGIEMQPKPASSFRQRILDGDFAGALEILPCLTTSEECIHRVRFLILSHKYKEAIVAGDLQSALHCLRHELQPYGARSSSSDSTQRPNADALHALASMLVTPPHNLAQNGDSSVEKKIREQRELLLADLQALLPPSMMVPESRLEELVEQALLAQLDRCPYHNSRTLQLSLFTDYVAGPEQLPTELSQVLDAHSNEVWVANFSNDGRWLITASKDGQALLWSVRDESSGGDHDAVHLSKSLLQISAPINIATFSPNSKKIAIGSGDAYLRFFDVESGNCQFEIHLEVGGSLCAAWMPDSRHVVISSSSRDLQIIDIENVGNVVSTITVGHHIYDAVVTRDGSACVTVCQDRCLRYLRLSDRKEAKVGPEPSAVTCLSASPDGRFLAANMANGVVHLWPLGEVGVHAEQSHPSFEAGASRPGSTDPLDALPAAPLQEFRAETSGQPGRFVIRSAFGGTSCSFLASGSEHGLVHIWHRESGEMLATLKGHSSSVNAVTWNPRDQYMLATASDDHTVKIWRAPATRTNVGSQMSL